MTRALDRLLARRTEGQEHRARIQTRVSELDTEIQVLASAIATGAPTGPLTDAIRVRDAERQRLRSDLAALDAVPALTRRDREELRRELDELMTEWRGVLLAHTSAARQILRKLLANKVRFIPEDWDGESGWRMEAEGTVQPLL